MDSCGHRWCLWCLSSGQAPYPGPGVHQEKVRLLVCTAGGQQHPKGEMPLPAQEHPGVVSWCTQKGSLLPCTHWSPLEASLEEL